MKGVVAMSIQQGKRRGRSKAVAVLVLVMVSILVPLVLLLRCFPSGNTVDDHKTSGNGLHKYGRLADIEGLGGGSSRVDSLLRKFGDNLSKDAIESHTFGSDIFLSTKPISKRIDNIVQSVLRGKAASSLSQSMDATFDSKSKDSSIQHMQKLVTSQSEVLPTLQSNQLKLLPASSNRVSDGKSDTSNFEESSNEDNANSCVPRFGSYCIWSLENKEVMKDSLVKRLKDQLFVARAYYPSVAKLNGQVKLSQELKQNIQEHEKMLSEVISDADLPVIAGKKIERMDQTISRVKSCTVDCNNVDKKLRQILDLTEDEAKFHMKQSAFLYQLGVQTIPKSHHCLSMRLTVEYFKSPLKDSESLHYDKVDSPQFVHYVIFSNNVLATSVAVNSTVINMEVTENAIFHVVTNTQKYFAMKHWFAKSSYKDAIVDIINCEDLNLDEFKSNLAETGFLEEFQVSSRKNNHSASKTEYLSVFGHQHFLLPEIFKKLSRVVVLDDDVVVQQDLSPLWNLNLEGKVNGAVESCGVRLGQLPLQKHMREGDYNASSCLWISGVNIIDLDKWREHNVTERYLHLLKNLMKNGASSSTASISARFLAFSNLIYPLDKKWTLSGLGHDYGVPKSAIENAALLHFNGNMKPWLGLGIPKYKMHWKKYLTRNQFMDDCNVNP